MNSLVTVRYKNKQRTLIQKIFGLNKYNYITELKEPDIVLIDENGSILKCEIEETDVQGTFNITSKHIITKGQIKGIVKGHKEIKPGIFVSET